MPYYVIVAGLVASALLSLLFSTLTYALRDFSRSRLTKLLETSGKDRWLEPTLDHTADLIFITAVIRLFSNLFVLLGVLRLIHELHMRVTLELMLSAVIAGTITLFVSVAIPNAAAKYSGESWIAGCVGLLHSLRLLLSPITQIMHWIDRLVKTASGARTETQPEQLEQEIVSVVEEGVKEGIVDQQEREMIKSVIQFRDTTVGQIMTARTEIVGIELHASLPEVKQLLEESGHSRIPIYDGTLDHIVGILYARDLLKHLGLPPEKFDIRSAMRAAFYVPETKPLRDLLQDFRLQKVHIAIVLDEYGGTGGLVSIEDILEELVGEISDEHEPQEPAALKRISDLLWEADARVYLDELNRVVGIHLPDDAGYDTLGGFISNVMGRIPVKDSTIEHSGCRFTILDAEPQKINRVKIELLPEHAGSDSPMI